MSASQKEQLKQRMRSDQIFSIFQENPHYSFTAEEFLEKLGENSQIDSNELLKEFKKLSGAGKIRVIIDKDNPLRYQSVPSELWTQFTGLKEEHYKIHSLIEKSGNTGIWRRDIKKQSGIPEKLITSFLSDLESRQLIKSIQSIHESRHKLYILYDLVPSSEVTGGVWYQEGHFNTQLVDQLIQYTQNLIKGSPGILESELVQKIMSSSVSTIRISSEEARSVIKAVLNTGKAIKIGGTLRPGPSQSAVCPISTIPCSKCPLAMSCEPSGAICPKDCPYMMKMTELF